MVDGSRVLQDDEVKPSTPALPSGADTPLATWAHVIVSETLSREPKRRLTNFLKLGTGLAQILSLEDTLSDTSGLLGTKSVLEVEKRKKLDNSRMP